MNWWKTPAVAGLIVALSAGLVACGDDSPSAPADPCPSAPAAPGSVTSSVNGTTVTIGWAAATCADSYTVQLTHTSGSESPRTETTSGTSQAFSNLTAGESYSAVVTAVNGKGQTPGTATSIDVPVEDSDIVVVSGPILSNTAWSSDKTYIIQGVVIIGEDCGPNPASPGSGCTAATLTIEPGTTILGQPNPPAPARSSYIVVARGSQLVADANANRADKSARPNAEDVIVFTSNKAPGSRARADWGGLVINGRAPINTGDEALGEGDTGFYGGVDDTDSSGILRGVRVEFAGDNFTETDQLNGIAFQGVGAGTTIDYVQVHYNEDDGVEPFGGSVSMTHMVMTGIGDDSFDGTDGYQGFIQFGIAQQRADAADQGFEFSNNGDNEDIATPASSAIAANVTLVGASHFGEIAGEGAKSDFGMLLREGAQWRLFNNIATGFGRAGFCIEGAGAKRNADNRMADAGNADPDPSVTLRGEGLVVWATGADATDPADEEQNLGTRCSGDDFPADTKAFFNEANFKNIIADPNLTDDAFIIGTASAPPNFVATALPTGFEPATFADLTRGLIQPVDGRRLVATSYPGAVEPGTALTDAWYYGWTIWANDGSDSRDYVPELP